MVFQFWYCHGVIDWKNYRKVFAIKILEKWKYAAGIQMKVRHGFEKVISSHWGHLRSKMGHYWNRNELIDYSISIYNLNELLLNIPLLVYMPSNEQSIRVPLPTTRDNLKKYIDDDFILDGKSNGKLISSHRLWAIVYLWAI